MDMEYFNKFLAVIRPDDVRGWFQERYENSLRIAATKADTDRRGWLEDAAFYAAALELLKPAS